MKTSKTGPFFIGAVLSISLVLACGAARQANAKRDADKIKPPPPQAAALWDEIAKNDPYTGWNFYPAKGKDAGLFAGLVKGRTPASNPHGAYMKLYANKIAVKAAKEEAGAKPMPSGSVLVMENYDKDKTKLLSITVMYKVKGYNPKAGDWFWAIYGPDGKPGESGKVRSCIECHKLQKKNDWRFAGAQSSGHHHHE